MPALPKRVAKTPHPDRVPRYRANPYRRFSPPTGLDPYLRTLLSFSGTRQVGSAEVRTGEGNEPTGLRTVALRNSAVTPFHGAQNTAHANQPIRTGAAPHTPPSGLQPGSAPTGAGRAHKRGPSSPTAPPPRLLRSEQTDEQEAHIQTRGHRKVCSYDYGTSWWRRRFEH